MIQIGDVFGRTKEKPYFDVVVGILPSENNHPEFLLYRNTKEGINFFLLDEEYLKNNRDSLRSREEYPKDSRYYLGQAREIFEDKKTVNCPGSLAKRVNFQEIYQNITDLLASQ